MFRRWLSGFISKNKEKFGQVFKLGFIAILIAMVALGAIKDRDEKLTDEEKLQTTYKPRETIAKGDKIKKEEYKVHTNVVNQFVDFCNEGKVQEAYNLLTYDCKENLYPTVEKFKEFYCDTYFNQKKTYNLQSWVNKGDKVTYQMRITNDILDAGEYNPDSTYQDYITLVEEEGIKKVCINGFVEQKQINKETVTNEFKVNITKKEVYMDFVEYSMKVTNLTNNVVLLDDMQVTTYSLRLASDNEYTYRPRMNTINYTELLINPGETRKIEIGFNKDYTIDSEDKLIVFARVIKNYKEYIKGIQTYNDFTSIKADV